LELAVLLQFKGCAVAEKQIQEVVGNRINTSVNRFWANSHAIILTGRVAPKLLIIQRRVMRKEANYRNMETAERATTQSARNIFLIKRREMSASSQFMFLASLQLRVCFNLFSSARKANQPRNLSIIIIFALLADVVF